MKLCDLQTGRIRLTSAHKALREEWLQTTDDWNDANRIAFEQEHLQPLAPQLTLLMAALQELGDVLAEAERDCSDENERWEL